MAHPRLEILASSNARIARSANSIRQTVARVRVLHADPLNPPAPPEGAHAVVVTDHTGCVVSYGWCAPHIPRKALYARAHEWAEMVEAMPACSLLREA